MFKQLILNTTLLILLTLTCSSVYAQGVATRHTATKLVPPGKYMCQMGSYKYRPCTVEANKDGVKLVIPDGKGHYISMVTELLPSDGFKGVTVRGTSTQPAVLCPTCTPGEATCNTTTEDIKACQQQTIVGRLKAKSKNVFSGDIHFYILRYSYEKKTRAPLPMFKLARTIKLSIKPAK